MFKIAFLISLLIPNPAAALPGERSAPLKKKRKVRVAVIDTGADISHPALKKMIWTNSKEIPNNNIDDDENGFIDDVHGWNFVTNSPNVTDTHGHGTHIAGIVSHVSDNVELMIVKYYDPQSLSDKNLVNTVRAIDYAIKNGAEIINYSGGGFGANPEEEKAIQRALEKNIAFVAAAGNDSENSDKKPFFPASYELENIISVASIGKNSELVESSNFGELSVDIAAPGENILSTLPNGRYGRMTGTSQATAYVTGALAAVMGEQRHLSLTKHIEQIANTGILNTKLTGKTKYQSNLSTSRALVMKASDISALGTVTENTKILDPNIFSSTPSVVAETLTHMVEELRQKKNLRSPAQIHD